MKTITTANPIGFIGLGVMGRGMAANLMKAGFSLNIYTRTKSSAQEIMDTGAIWCESPADVARKCDVVITIVGYPQDVEETYLGENGILSTAKENSIIIDMTTSSPQLAAKIAEKAAEKNVYALDAPVSGGDIGAKGGTLSIMAGGDKGAFEAALPVFEAMGKNIVFHGPAGSGQHCKASNQIAIASTMMGVCEAIRYAEKAGLDPQTVLQSIAAGAAGSWSMNNLVPKMLAGDFEPGFFVKHFIKDMGIAVDSAEKMGFTAKGLPVAYEMYKKVAENGEEDKGTQVLYKYY